MVLGGDVWDGQNVLECCDLDWCFKLGVVIEKRNLLCDLRVILQEGDSIGFRTVCHMDCYDEIYINNRMGMLDVVVYTTYSMRPCSPTNRG